MLLKNSRQEIGARGKFVAVHLSGIKQLHLRIKIELLISVHIFSSRFFVSFSPLTPMRCLFLSFYVSEHHVIMFFIFIHQTCDVTLDKIFTISRCLSDFLFTIYIVNTMSLKTLYSSI